MWSRPKIFKPNDSTKKLCQMVLSQVTGNQAEGNRTFRQKKFETFRQFFFAETSAAIFLPKRLLPKRPVPLSDMSPFPLVPRGPLAAYFPILLSEVEQEQRPSGNGDREAIVVGAGLCDGEGERAYIAFIMRDVSANFFSLRRFGIFFAETSAAMFLPKRLLPKRPEFQRRMQRN